MNKWTLYLLLFITTIGQAKAATNKTALTAIIATIEQQFNVRILLCCREM
jgi:hypothetical protein